MITIDVGELRRWARVYTTAPERSASVLMQAVNDTGNAARTQVIRTLARQMGLPAGTVRQNLVTRPASLRSLSYEIVSRGAYLSLRSFGAMPRRGGVSARPWGKRRVFRGTFIVRQLGGQVFRRTTPARHPISALWGPAIPTEMIRDAVPKAFDDAIAERLPRRLAHHLDRLLPKTPGIAE
jgi:hypothetical protein